MITVGSTERELALAAGFKEGAPPFGFTGFEENFHFDGGVYRDDSGLELKCEREEYEGAAALEWTLWLTNKGTENSRSIKELLPLKTEFEAGENCSISFAKGARSMIDDFTFVEQEITDRLRLESVGSRIITPFFNLDLGGRGVLIAVGWTKNWFLELEKQDGKISVRAGMPVTDFYLEPGERVRTPRIMLLFWEGDKERSYNLLRRHLVRNHVPKDANGEPYPPVCLSSWGSMKTKNHLRLLDFVKREGLEYDAYWIDAGWYGEDHDAVEYQKLNEEDWFYYQGDWSVNRTIHPDTLKPVSDAAHALGMKLLLWYDVYNCIDGIGWTKDHPEWGRLEGPMGKNETHEAVMVSMLNVNNPEARKWLVDTLINSMEENGVDYYREDPPPIYGGEDGEGRTGIAEMKAVEALYSIWDMLHERFPGILIDNCGGGGSRVDLESVSRAYVLWRSDYNCSPYADPIGSQAGNIGLGHFVPLVNCAPPTKPGDDYTFRSGLYGGIGFGLFHSCAYENGLTYPEPDYPVEWHKRKLREYRDVKPYFSGDFWTLADCGIADDGWASYEMNRPDLGEGVILAFRRPKCEAASIKLKPVLEDGIYELTNRDTGERTIFDSSRDTEIEVCTEKPASSVMLMIKKIKED